VVRSVIVNKLGMPIIQIHKYMSSVLLFNCMWKGANMENKEIDELMARHFEAVNANDIDSFMDTWAENARIEFLLTGKVVEGKENLRKSFLEQLFNPLAGIKTEIAKELRYKNFRTYVERITECSDTNLVGLEIHWTLEFKDGKIDRVWTLQ